MRCGIPQPHVVCALTGSTQAIELRATQMRAMAVITNRVRWVHPDKGRYYEVRLVQDLWGHTVVLSCCGQTGTALGRQVAKPVADQAECLAMLAGIARRRDAHGCWEAARS